MTVLSCMRPLLALGTALLLTACGGGETNPGTQLAAELVGVAQGVECAGGRNRLYTIDQKFVLWDRADLRCADASYSRQLFAVGSTDALCSNGDSIAGPVTSCKDSTLRAMFDTILKNLEQPDLGLGSGHQVTLATVLPKSGTSLAFDQVAADSFSGVTTAQNVVVKDAAAWTALWAQIGANHTPAPALPVVDFSKKMLLAVFTGTNAGACQKVAVSKVSVGGAKIIADIEKTDLSAVALCVQSVTTPALVIAIERSDAKVEFITTLKTAS